MTSKFIGHADYESTTTPLDTDRVPVLQAYATTPVSKTITWTNIKAFLKTYFDTLYAKTQTSYTTSDFSKTSDTTLANVTGLTATLAAGATYVIKATLYLSVNASYGAKSALSGTATATTINAAMERTAGSTGNHYTDMSTALNTACGSTATYVMFRWTATIVVNAGGTLTIQFAQNASGGTASKVLTGSFMQVEKVS